MTRKANLPSRRDFIKSSLVSAAVVSGLSMSSFPVHAAEQNTIKIALIGAGGRGTGAAVQALSTAGPTKMWAIADVFAPRAKGSLEGIKASFPDQEGKVDVPQDRMFLGMDAYKKAIDSLDPGDVVILATPPVFRPLHMEYAVQKGLHIFAEKSLAVDGPGCRRQMEVNKKAEENNLKIATGLKMRHHWPTEACIEQIHQGTIGDITSLWVYRVHNTFGLPQRSPDTSDLVFQMINHNNFNWLCGSLMLDWMIHNLDVASWAANVWPVSCQGQGGRAARQDKDNMFDHFCLEYKFDDDRPMLMQGRHINNTWGFFGTVIRGTKGVAVLGEGVYAPKIYKGTKMSEENVIWQYTGQNNNEFQTEHDLFFKAIRENQPYNELERSVKATMSGIIARMAAESGQEIFAKNVWESNEELTPGVDALTLDSPAPAQPDENGNYAIAVPGTTLPR